MTSPDLTVAHRVVVDVVRQAALEVPGVMRVDRRGGRVLAWFRGAPIRVRVRDGGMETRVWLIARPGLSLVSLVGEVRAAVGASVERLLGLEARDVTVVVDGVGT